MYSSLVLGASEDSDQTGFLFLYLLTSVLYLFSDGDMLVFFRAFLVQHYDFSSCRRTSLA